MGCAPSLDNPLRGIFESNIDRRRDSVDVYDAYIAQVNSSFTNEDESNNHNISMNNWSLCSNHHFPYSGIHGLVGLQNLGNTCFMNCSLQCLSHTIKLVDYFTESSNWRHQINRSNPLGRNGEVAEAFGEFLNTIYGNIADSTNKSENKSFVVHPLRLKNTLAKYLPQFRGTNQHDAQELLAFLLDGLHEDLNQIQSKPWVEDIVSDGSKGDEEVAQESWRRYLQRNRSIIVDLLQGQLKSALKCSQCGTQSIKFETFMFLSVPVSTDKESMELRDCLDQFCCSEKLDGDHKWQCPTCKEFRDAEKSIQLWSVPSVLIIHLKRFHQPPEGERFKIKNLVNFPTRTLDLSNIVLSSGKEDPLLYDLYGVSNHHGSLHGGHYTATIKNRFDNQWYVCNDSSYHKISESDICTRDAYVLYYHRRESITRRTTIESSNYSYPTENNASDRVDYVTTASLVNRMPININARYESSIRSIEDTISDSAFEDDASSQSSTPKSKRKDFKGFKKKGLRRKIKISIANIRRKRVWRR